MAGQFSHFVDIFTLLHSHFQEAGFAGERYKGERLLIVAKVKPLQLCELFHSGILFPKDCLLQLLTCQVFPHRCFLSTAHVPGSEERVLVFSEPVIRGTQEVQRHL